MSVELAIMICIPSHLNLNLGLLTRLRRSSCRAILGGGLQLLPLRSKRNNSTGSGQRDRYDECRLDTLDVRAENDGDLGSREHVPQVCGAGSDDFQGADARIAGLETRGQLSFEGALASGDEECTTDGLNDCAGC